MSDQSALVHKVAEALLLADENIWKPDGSVRYEQMAKVAIEALGLTEEALPSEIGGVNDWRVRWVTPWTEVDA